MEQKYELSKSDLKNILVAKADELGFTKKGVSPNPFFSLQAAAISLLAKDKDRFQKYWGYYMKSGLISPRVWSPERVLSAEEQMEARQLFYKTQEQLGELISDNIDSLYNLLWSNNFQEFFLNRWDELFSIQVFRKFLHFPFLEAESNYTKGDYKKTSADKKSDSLKIKHTKLTNNFKKEISTIFESEKFNKNIPEFFYLQEVILALSWTYLKYSSSKARKKILDKFKNSPVTHKQVMKISQLNFAKERKKIQIPEPSSDDQEINIYYQNIMSAAFFELLAGNKEKCIDLLNQMYSDINKFDPNSKWGGLFYGPSKYQPEVNAKEYLKLLTHFLDNFKKATKLIDKHFDQLQIFLLSEDFLSGLLGFYIQISEFMNLWQGKYPYQYRVIFYNAGIKKYLFFYEVPIVREFHAWLTANTKSTVLASYITDSVLSGPVENLFVQTVSDE